MIYFSLANKKINLMKDDNNINFENELTKLKTSLSDEEIVGSIMKYSGIKKYHFGMREDTLLNALYNNKNFFFLANNPIDNEEDYFEFKLSPNSADFEDFKEFCSLEYFDNNN